MLAITLEELRSYAKENRNTVFDVTSCLSCLACSMLKERHPGSSVQWVPQGHHDRPSSLHASYMLVYTPDRVEMKYSIPSDYIDWCAGIQTKLDDHEEGIESTYSGGQLARIIHKMEYVTYA